MAIATLEAIIAKVRKLAVAPNTNQLTNDQIIDYINSFYIYDFPAQFRSLDLKDVYTFNTIEGIDTYPFDKDHWVNVQGPAYIAKREIPLFSNPDDFYNFNFSSNSMWQQEEVIATGDGTADATGTLGSTPLLRSINNNPMVTTNTANTSSFPDDFPVSFGDSNINRIQNILITTNLANGTTLNVTDDGAGGLIGDIAAGTNTIDYDTGAIDVTFSQTTVSGENIVCLYRPVTLEMPLAIVFFQNQFTLSPVPDKGYTVEITGYRLPSQALLGSGTTTDISGRPELEEWWEILAVGAAKKVYEDRLDMDGIGLMDKLLMDKYSLAETRTYANLGKNRVQTIYTNQSYGDYGNSPFGFGNF